MKHARLILPVLIWLGYASTVRGLPPAEANKGSTSVTVTIPTLRVDHKGAHDAFRIAMGDLLGNVVPFKDGNGVEGSG